MAFYELRQYKVLPGKMAEWVRIMEQEIIPVPGLEGHGHLRQLSRRDRRLRLCLAAPVRKRSRARGAVQGGLRKRPLEERDRAAHSELLDREKIVVTRMVPTMHSTVQ